MTDSNYRSPIRELEDVGVLSPLPLHASAGFSRASSSILDMRDGGRATNRRTGSGVVDGLGGQSSGSRTPMSFSDHNRGPPNSTPPIASQAFRQQGGRSASKGGSPLGSRLGTPSATEDGGRPSGAAALATNALGIHRNRISDGADNDPDRRLSRRAQLDKGPEVAATNRASSHLMSGDGGDSSETRSRKRQVSGDAGVIVSLDAGGLDVEDDLLDIGDVRVALKSLADAKAELAALAAESR